LVLARRDKNEKVSIPISESIVKVEQALENIADILYENASKLLNENMHHVETVDEAKTLKGIIQLPWCGNDQCALEIEEVLDGNTLGEPIEEEKIEHQTCPICGKQAVTWMRYAKTY